MHNTVLSKILVMGKMNIEVNGNELILKYHSRDRSENRCWLPRKQHSAKLEV